MHGLILSEWSRLSISTECILSERGTDGGKRRELLVTGRMMDQTEASGEWLVTGRSDSNKWQHSEPRLRSARGQARGRDEDPGRGHPVLAGPAHQLLGPGQAYHLHSRYPYIHTTQPCYSLINSRLLTKKDLKISLFFFESDRQMESRIYPPMLKSLGLQCTAEMDFLHTCNLQVWIQSFNCGQI